MSRPIDVRRFRRPIVGLLFWIVAVAGAWRWLASEPDARDGLARVARHVAFPTPPVFEAEFPLGSDIRLDEVVRIESDGLWLDAGYVVSYEIRPNHIATRIAIYPEFARLLRADARLESVTASGDVMWVMTTLLPKEKMDRIKSILSKAWDEDKQRLWRELEPGVMRLISDVTIALRDEMPNLVRERRADFQVLAEVVREKAWEGRLRGVFEQEIWPRVENRALPILAEIGDEITKKAPVMSLSWSFVRDRLPFTRDDAMRNELQKFIKTEVIPIVEQRRDVFKKESAELIKEALQQEKVLTELQSAATDVFADPRFRDAMRSIIETWTTSNPKVLDLLKDGFARNDIRGPIERFFDVREDDVHDIANLILLDDRGYGISPDLARVLRRKVLGESRAWIWLVPGESGEFVGQKLNAVRGGVK